MHNKTKVYISQIRNLSDARYFAAREVDYLGFPISNAEDLDRMRQISEWCEGPTFVIEYEQARTSEALLDAIAAFPLAKVCVLEHFTDFLPATTEVLLKTTGDQNPNYDGKERVIATPFNGNLYPDDWIIYTGEANDIKKFLTNFNPYGIVLLGGEEEKPGIRDFAEIDEIMDFLEGQL